MSMNFLCGSFFPAVVCATVLTTSPTVAQAQQPIELEYQHDNTWLSPNEAAGQVTFKDTLKFRVRGLEQMWVNLVLDARFAGSLPTGFQWMTTDPSTPIGSPNFLTICSPQSPNDQVGVLEDRMLLAAMLGVNVPGTSTYNESAVSDWFVPLVGNSMTTWRNWVFDAPLWDATESLEYGLGNGPNCQGFWYAASMENMTGEVSHGPDAFSVEALYYLSIVLRAAANQHPDPFGAANAFLATSQFQESLECGNDSNVLMIQALGLRSEEADGPVGDDHAAARFGPPTPPAQRRFPLCHITTRLTLPLIFPKLRVAPSPASVIGLTGSFVPNAAHYFSARTIASPVMIRFPVNGGGTRTVLAAHAICHEDPLRYVLRVPPDVATGTVTLSDSISPNADYIVGSVDSVVK